MNEDKPISPAQCRMARAALNISIIEVGKAAKVSPNTVARYERGEKLMPRTIEAIQTAFEKSGIEFGIDGKGWEFVVMKP